MDIMTKLRNAWGIQYSEEKNSLANQSGAASAFTTDALHYFGAHIFLLYFAGLRVML